MFKSNKDLMSTGFIDGWMAEKAKNPGRPVPVLYIYTMEEAFETGQYMAGLLEQENFEFFGENHVVYYNLEYMPVFMHKFPALAALDAFLNYDAAAFGAFRGVLVLNLSDWYFHEAMDSFDLLMKYLWDQKEDLCYVIVTKGQVGSSFARSIGKYFDVLELEKAGELS